MSNGLAVVALLLALLAGGFAAYAVLQAPLASDDLEARIAVLEDELSRVEAELGALREATRPPPSLMGLGPEAAGASTGVGERAPSASTETVAEGAPTGSTPVAAAEGEAEGGRLEDLVDAAVEKKAAQLQAMREKKPSLDVFASVLALDDAQRETVAKGVAASQAEIRSILEIPAEDGTVFLDEFVEALALRMARPKEDPERAKRLFQRLLVEKVPGTDTTYAQQAEAVKSRLRSVFQRTMTPKQYATFEAWRMDPTEVKGVPGSPWKELEGRVRERARVLGAGSDGPR